MRHLYIEKPYSEDDKVLNLSALLLKILRYSGLKEGMYVTAYEPYDIYFCKCYDLITIKEGKFVLRKSTMKTGGSYEYEYIPIEVIPDKVCYHFIRNYFSGCLYSTISKKPIEISLNLNVVTLKVNYQESFNKKRCVGSVDYSNTLSLWSENKTN